MTKMVIGNVEDDEYSGSSRSRRLTQDLCMMRPRFKDCQRLGRESFGKSKITTFTAKSQKCERAGGFEARVSDFEKKYEDADTEIERLQQRNMELVAELDEATDMARQQKAEIVRLESANVILF